MKKLYTIFMSVLLIAVLLTGCRSAADMPSASLSDQQMGETSSSQSAVETAPDQSAPAPQEADKPAEPVEPEKPAEPVKPEKPAEPVKPEKPAEPVKPEKPAEPVKPEKPAKPAKPEKPAEPAKPEPPAVKPSQKLYILMYHDIVEDGTACNDWTITTGRLREDLQWLRDHGYTFVLPRELSAGTPLPPKAVMVTFDDGYASNCTLGLPIFQELNVKCVVALITHHMEDQTPGFLSWDQCRAMQATGLVEFASHTHNLHIRSTDPDGPHGVQRLTGETREAYEARVFTDLQTSIDLITKNLGQAPAFLAYPHGLTDQWEQEFSHSHFKASVTTNHGPADMSRGFYNMNRHNISMGHPVSQYLPE